MTINRETDDSEIEFHDDDSSVPKQLKQLSVLRKAHGGMDNLKKGPIGRLKDTKWKDKLIHYRI